MMSSLPSGVRLVALLNEHLSDIMSRERANHYLHPLVLHGSLLGGVRALGLSVAPCVPGQRDYADALARLPVSGGDGVRDGSFAPLVCPQAHLAKRRARITSD